MGCFLILYSVFLVFVSLSQAADGGMNVVWFLSWRIVVYVELSAARFARQLVTGVATCQNVMLPVQKVCFDNFICHLFIASVL